jgi:23S rRNA (uracil1939-C5)-methyltransferase
MLTTGAEIELDIEKPVAGGRMLARHGGQIVFVHAAIPGERVRARVDRVERQLAFAATVAVVQASPDRRETTADLLCGGCSYAHVGYPRQLALKAEVIHDAFARLGRIPLDRPVAVLASPERGYRMRARFHARTGRDGVTVGFYREGTHELCDASSTGQLRDESVAAVKAAVAAASESGPIASAELCENIAADQRALHINGAPETAISTRVLTAAMHAGNLTGCSAAVGGKLIAAGTPAVEDPLPALTAGRAGSGALRRHAESFFQANRYLLPHLVGDVLDAVLPDGAVIDLYAGVGLFAVSLAHSGRERITAVEGDRVSARDLAHNASTCAAAVRVVTESVEGYLAAAPRRAETIIVDPPRTGMSRTAMEAIVRSAPARVVYVSCDPPTMGRDARRLLDAGYRLTSLRAFDLFPNTPHVESLGVFDRVRS